MILTVLKSTLPKVRPKQIVHKKIKNFDLNNFKNEIRTKMQSIEKHETFEKEFLKVLNKKNDKRFSNRGYSLFFLMGTFLKHLSLISNILKWQDCKIFTELVPP